jgi:macrodomain Ter protein organizer (MatP/YcbG family)
MGGKLQSIELGQSAIMRLETIAMYKKTSVAETIEQWIDEAEENIWLNKTVKAAIKYNEGKATISAKELYKECGI